LPISRYPSGVNAACHFLTLKVLPACISRLIVEASVIDIASNREKVYELEISINPYFLG
jgi:hypothetical protein